MQVTEVNRFTAFDHFGALFHHQPADVGKEEASLDVVRVAVGFRELVVSPVVTAPVEEVILCGACVQNGEQHTKRQVGLEGQKRFNDEILLKLLFE